MSDVPADIEAIRHARQIVERLDQRAVLSAAEFDGLLVGIGNVPALLAGLDGERRQRADLERQLEEADARLVRFGWHISTCSAWDPENVDGGDCDCGFEAMFEEASTRAFLARQVVQEAETP